MLLVPTPFLLGKPYAWQSIFAMGEIDSYVQIYTGLRVLVKPANGFPLAGKRLRVTFAAPPNVNSPCATAVVGVGKWDGASVATKPPATVANPVELKFGGLSGFNITRTTIRSDPLDFVFGQNDGLVFCLDYAGATIGPYTYVAARYDKPNCVAWMTAKMGEALLKASTGSSTNQVLYDQNIAAIANIEVWQ
jgi:hypothetical protein